MTGYPGLNVNAFMDAAEVAYSQGHVVYNPATKDWLLEPPPMGIDANPQEYYDKLLRRALTHLYLFQPDQLWMLPGWEVSQGACFEVLKGVELGAEVVRFLP